MSSGSQHQGFAIALLLWLIAGMTLMVAAVVHFARADISLAELRLQEAKAVALSRATARLLIRDNAMRDATVETDQNELLNRESASGGAATELYKSSYEFMNGWTTTGSMHGGNTLVSLNSSTAAELDILIRFVGLSASEVRAAFIEGIQAYRDKFPGFRYKEELLAVNGSSRMVYDSIALYVHPFRTGRVVWPEEYAKQMMQAGLIDERSVSSDAQDSSKSNTAGRASGRITFASIAERRKQAAGAGDSETAYVDVTIRQHDIGDHIGARVWVSLNSPDPILRTEMVYH